MKKTLSICGAVLFVLGFAMATGVDQNPIQAIGTLILMGAACYLFRRADAIRASEKTPTGSAVVKPAHYQDAA